MTELEDLTYMKRALRLAAHARGATNPNPMVGAIICNGGVIIGQGFHHKAGAAHAEVEALKDATDGYCKGATLYITLEPCAHFGKTPPCVTAIQAAGITRVVCAISDPNPVVNGSGIQALRTAGLQVDVGLLHEEARKLNEAFFTYHEKHRPYVAIKFAATLDGKMATEKGDSKWITNAAARAYARQLRGYYEAILVGINTVIQDDPHLGVRSMTGTDPLRIILDTKLRIPLDAQVLRDSNVLVLTTKLASKKNILALQNRGAEVVQLPDVEISIPKLMHLLYEKNIVSVFVEGGSAVLGSFLDNRVIDKVYAFYAPRLLGGARSLSLAGKGMSSMRNSLELTDITIKRFEDNFLVSGCPITE
jgi:diaminohydroxyphosphoribosylaminopyrimidine deaminase/5-amino-6-(5-phosphoribosylamino)uracil reductase